MPPGVPLWAWESIARADGDRWTIPERDASGAVVGTAYRAVDGAKDFKKGGRRGLILPWPLPAYAGSSAADPIILDEGASDTGAMLGLAFDAVGTPMAGYGGAMAAELLPGRHVVLVAHADDAGRRGAQKIAGALLARCASVRIIEPPLGAKDARDSIIAGATKRDFEDLIEMAEPIVSGTPIPSPKISSPAVRAFAPFPVNALPAVLRRFAAVTAQRMGCDPVFLIQPTLAVLSGAVGNSVVVVVRKGWFEPCAVWTAIVAPPSSMGSPARRAAMEPTYEAQRRADLAYAEAMTRYELEVFKADIAIDTARKAARGGEAVTQLPAKPVKPPRPQWVVSNATWEALAHVLHANQRGALSDQDELASLFGSFGAYSKSRTNAAEPGAGFYKSAWSGETYTENRKSDGGTYIRIERPLLSVYGKIQPAALGPVLGQQRIQDGFASRFLWVLPPDAPAWFPDERADEDAGHADAYAAVHRQLCAIPMNSDADGNPSPRYVGLTREAQAIGREWVNANAERIVAESDPALRAALGKLKGYLFRFALLFHLIEWADARQGADLGPVGPDCMRRAVTVTAWYAREFERVYGLLAESAEEAGTRWLVEWIARRGGSVTARDLTRGPREYRNNPDRAEKALGELVAAGVGRWEWPRPGPQGGPPSRVFRLVAASGDGGDGDTTPPDGHASGGNVAVATPTDAGDGWGEL